jgi:hypothetical protein
MYFNARYYDPTTGRFLTEDPSRKGVNWYAYCENDPINRTDPTGKDATDFYAAMSAHQNAGEQNAISARYGQISATKNTSVATAMIKTAIDIGHQHRAGANAPAAPRTQENVPEEMAGFLAKPMLGELISVGLKVEVAAIDLAIEGVNAISGAKIPSLSDFAWRSFVWAGENLLEPVGRATFGQLEHLAEQQMGFPVTGR